jgi:hypothetical protein
MMPNRKGTTTEYKRGHFYLSHTIWEDGHEEIEIHRCAPQQLFHSYDGEIVKDALVELHSCDVKEFPRLLEKFSQLPLTLGKVYE